jgi:hypothetical protein
MSDVEAPTETATPSSEIAETTRVAETEPRLEVSSSNATQDELAASISASSAIPEPVSSEGPESLLEGSDFVAAEATPPATEPGPATEAASSTEPHDTTAEAAPVPHDDAPGEPTPVRLEHDAIEETVPMPLHAASAEDTSASAPPADALAEEAPPSLLDVPADVGPSPTIAAAPADAEPARPHDEASVEPSPSLDELALAEADPPDDDEDGGPHTLAAMLPDPVGEWPPRKRRQRKAPLPAIEARHREASERSDPRFVREARRGERWTRPGVRASLGLLLFVLVLGAAAQVAWPLRDVIAARWPAAVPAIELACEQMGCTVEAPRSLTSLALDGSSLTRTDTEHVLLFSADLHNRSDHAVRMPSFDLSFTDLNGQVVARKVLAPSEIGIRQASLGPDAELHVHARLQITGVDATGFQAEMFYP